ncbi:MAG: hypothetical protein ABI311_10855 [Gemmatimonadaceae bacterium]
MTATDTEAMSALHALLDERQRYQGWLATLESRRNSTPPHVYERVQQDYVGRLDRVMENLAERAGQLSGTISSLTSELSTLRQHEADRTDERHEAELRAAVGEFTPEDWDRRRAEADADLERIATDKHSLQAELEELQRIVALTGSIHSAEPPISNPGVGSPSGRAAAPAMSTGETAQSIEDFVAEWHGPQARSATGRAAEKSMDAEHAVPDGPDLDDLVIPAAPMGGNPVGAAGADYGIANGVSGVPAAGGTPPSRSQPAVQIAQGAQADVRRDADKTLKCPECGAMNYATEWYCEKCGGELSTF